MSVSVGRIASAATFGPLAAPFLGGLKRLPTLLPQRLQLRGGPIKKRLVVGEQVKADAVETFGKRIDREYERAFGKEPVIYVTQLSGGTGVAGG